MPHLEIDRDRRVWIVLQVDGEDLLADVVVVKLVIAQRHVDVEGQVLPRWQFNRLGPIL